MSYKIAVIMSLLPLSVFAEDTFTLDDMTVEKSVPAGNGLINIQDVPQAKSVISRSAIEQKNTQNNIYQAVDLLPGINTYSYDATGLFGGGLRMRGFNSDQIGISVDGVPIGDAGNYTVYPSEWAEFENLDEISVMQGSNPIDTSMVGATGGSISLKTINPTDSMRVRMQQSYGSYNAYKSFFRADTGYLADKLFKASISLSKAETDKWKGQGGADREHLEVKSVLNLPQNQSITASFLYNEMFNHNFRTLTKAEIQTFGQSADFGTQIPQHLAGINGSAQIEKIPANLYYNLNINPFKNSLTTLKGRFELLPKVHLDVDPYYIYGFGTGGNELRTLSESNASNRLGGGIRDINHDGDTLDTAMVYSTTLLETERPGVTTRLHSQIANHYLMAGYWFEYARQRRTQPAVPFGADGKSVDSWLENSAFYLQHQDGTAYMARNYVTLNTSQSFFAQDDIQFLNNTLLLSLGFRYSQIHRDFTNYASDGFGENANYMIQKTYAAPLPNVGVRYQFTDTQQIFVNRAENFKAPSDFSYYGLLTGGSFNSNGQFTGYSINPVNIGKESSTNWDLGYRYVGKNLSFSIDYRNRIAAAYDPVNNFSTNYNVGNSTTKGVEFESAWRFLPDWQIYGSFTFTDSRMNQNLRTGANTFEATAGKAFPDTPAWMSGLSLQYKYNDWSANLSAKYTGKRYSTLVNDESINGYTLVSFDAGYRFPSTEWFKNPSIRMNVYNLLNQKYLNLSSSSGSAFTNRALGVGGNAPSYYIGAPTSISVMLSTDF